MANNHFILPNWPAPAGIRAWCTTRAGGHSLAPFDAFNLATHVNDDPNAVSQNRAQLSSTLSLPNEPFWLEQTHSDIASEVGTAREADASFSRKPGEVCVVLTADCLPILLCAKNGKEIAAIHAGWRGLANQIIANTCEKLQTPLPDCLAWFGPAIRPAYYLVREDVRSQFPNAPEEAFRPLEDKADQWQMNLYALAKQQLHQQGLTDIFQSTHCTYSEPALFYSARRDQNHCGRIATLITMDP